MNFSNQRAPWKCMAVFSAFFPLIVDYIDIPCMHSTVRKVCHKYNSLFRVTDLFRENTMRWLQGTPSSMSRGNSTLSLGPSCQGPSLWGHLLSTVYLCSLGPFWIGTIFAQCPDLLREQNWANGRLCPPIFPLPRADGFAPAPENWNKRGRNRATGIKVD